MIISTVNKTALVWHSDCEPRGFCYDDKVNYYFAVLVQSEITNCSFLYFFHLSDMWNIFKLISVIFIYFIQVRPIFRPLLNYHFTLVCIS